MNTVTDPVLSGRNLQEEKFIHLRDGEEVPSQAELFAFFDRLLAMPAQRMLGDWAGGILSRGHPVEGQLTAMRWNGKRFSGADEVYPIISLDEQGNRVINDVLGTASLREVVFRGVATATMIYDKSPVFDHFRKVHENLVVGVMDQKGNENPLFFYLERLS
ncbi:DUF4334 domain-containing protein [uncultured Microbulbifer sp.]|uniref:DUF4334 domain-containing protein n=1 Tax=uncultured Microbulbifer sp. TaxID=348147 RepID=UPI0025F67C39|nr:DUF4334 domain-containing protein [uncultured Microbulbifer sp.]